ncbi:TIGR03619 family F420-dependent LLM class oxidoreductase [Mycobacterium intracellulare]|uniref:TIGR03619 family F420-dependent LLM class oxidoreductase n=1 Tax=Mycobacterium intracellulare TaxID=1767 RepID=UPI00335217D3
MKVYISTGFLPTRDIMALATAADELGYEGLGIPDHVVNFAELDTAYPYTVDGQRRWPPFTDWPDPWVLIGALAQATSRLRFVTTVYVAALRDPYSAAKAIGTAAFLAGGRLELGLGVGWCAEEFALMGQPFSGRGRRTEEALEVMQALWEPGWTEFCGDYYHAPRLEMTPSPPAVPVLFGGLTDLALRRAARYDGWIGDLMTTDQAIDITARLHQHRTDAGRASGDFTVLAPLTDVVSPEDLDRAEAGGITHILTQPWAYYCPPDAPTQAKIDAMARFRTDFKLDTP